MKFFDKIDRDPASEVYVYKTKKQVEDENLQAINNTEYTPKFNVVRELVQPNAMCLCSIKVRDLNIMDGFYDEKENYVSYRTE